jgi:hypothetical protein
VKSRDMAEARLPGNLKPVGNIASDILREMGV